MKARAIVFHQNGEPAEVAKLEEVDLPEPGPGQVQLKVIFAPINPADLNFIEGTYGTKASFPAIPGGEGLAEVVAVGGGASELRAGDHVLLSAGHGAWRERLTVDAAAVVRVPQGIDPQQAAMLRVNPPTAYRMLHDFVPLRPGEWVLQNASNSGVGRSLIQIAAAKGWKTVNLVRRADVVEELKAIGADAVVIEGDTAAEQIVSATGGQPIHLALNAVGGESAKRLAGALSPGGTMVTYGAMSRQPLRIPNGYLIFKDLRYRGFWVTQWFRTAPPAEKEAMFAELFALAREGRLHTPIDSIYPLQDIAAALKRAGEGGRSGKILLQP